MPRSSSPSTQDSIARYAKPDHSSTPSRTSDSSEPDSTIGVSRPKSLKQLRAMDCHAVTERATADPHAGPSAVDTWLFKVQDHTIGASETQLLSIQGSQLGRSIRSGFPRIVDAQVTTYSRSTSFSTSPASASSSFASDIYRAQTTHGNSVLIERKGDNHTLSVYPKQVKSRKGNRLPKRYSVSAASKSRPLDRGGTLIYKNPGEWYAEMRTLCSDRNASYDLIGPARGIRMED